MKKYCAEIIGTFALVFAGTGAIVVNDITRGAVGPVGVALTFGLAIMVMVYALGDVSGGHFNPAVSLGFWTAGRMGAREMGAYMVSQCLGALIASILVKLMFLDHVTSTLGVTVPAESVSNFRAFGVEVILTFFLVFVILNVTSGAKERSLFAGTAIGGTIALDALFGGPITGASMNPARSLGPAVVSGHLKGLWIYLLAPLAGAYLAMHATRLVRNKNS